MSRGGVVLQNPLLARNSEEDAMTSATQPRTVNFVKTRDPDSVAKMLQNLPSHNQANFFKFVPEQSQKKRPRRPAIYRIAATHPPNEKIFVLDETPLLLKHLTKKWRNYSNISTDQPSSSKDALTTTPTKEPNPGASGSTLKRRRAESNASSSSDDEAGPSNTSSASRGFPSRKMPRTL